MEAGKAEAFGALCCVISGDKLHVNVAVAAGAHSPLYKHPLHLCQMVGFFAFHFWLPSNPVKAG